ncbi:MAG: Lysine-tRNA ligase [Parcubacteria group bacterium GW2011_GWA1_36_12]|nr:MAG: Lysine-tRNA ligase [Parcubacteria group bacterium GW2011_GWA1_36_12]
MEPIEKLRKIRLDKLEKIKKLKIDPYPAKSNKKHSVSECLKSQDKNVQTAGRLMAIRGHGGSSFADLVDESGKIQLFFSKDKLSTMNYELLTLLDIGDFIEVSGKVDKTKAGELTIFVNEFKLLTKSIRPLPSTWYGLKDIEERYRKRYLDLLLNRQARQVFEIRSKIIQAHRQFLLDKDYIEVETPVLQPLYGGGLARPFKTYQNALGISLYMRISTELYLKRLIVAGFENVFEFARVFRNEGIDRSHNPEFTMLETMTAYADYLDSMKLVEEMTEHVVKTVIGTTKVKYDNQTIDFKTPWKKYRMVDLVKEQTGVDFDKISKFEDAVKEAKKLGVELKPFEKSVGLVLAEVFEQKCEQKLIQPTVIYDYPTETSPLAKKCKNPRYVERFEHYVTGMESSNNYSELNDPIDLGMRFSDERKKERLGEEEAHQTDKDFIESLEYGMPPTSGIGPSIDRLVMILTDSKSIKDVILFPTLKPENVKDKK